MNIQVSCDKVVISDRGQYTDDDYDNLESDSDIEEDDDEYSSMFTSVHYSIDISTVPTNNLEKKEKDYNIDIISTVPTNNLEKKEKVYHKCLSTTLSCISLDIKKELLNNK